MLVKGIGLAFEVDVWSYIVYITIIIYYTYTYAYIILLLYIIIHMHIHILYSSNHSLNSDLGSLLPLSSQFSFLFSFPLFSHTLLPINILFSHSPSPPLLTISFIQYVSVFILGYLYLILYSSLFLPILSQSSNPHDSSLTPHVLSEWMVEV